jgi:uncharacterized protein
VRVRAGAEPLCKWCEREAQDQRQPSQISQSQIFETPMLTALDDRGEYGEDRWVGIGLLRSRIVVIVWTEPSEETVRVISVRKALRYERREYEAAIQN